MCPSLIEIGSKTAEKNSAQTNTQTNRHYKNNGHLAVNQLMQQQEEEEATPGGEWLSWCEPRVKMSSTVDNRSTLVIMECTAAVSRDLSPLQQYSDAASTGCASVLNT